MKISRASFLEKSPLLFHRVEEIREEKPEKQITKAETKKDA